MTRSRFFAGLIACTTFLGCAAEGVDDTSEDGAEAVVATQSALSVPPTGCKNTSAGSVQGPDGRTETGYCSGGDACYAYKDINFDDDRQRLDRGLIYNSVGDFEEEISSFRVPLNCYIQAWKLTGGHGPETIFNSDTHFVGERWNDQILSYACLCID